MSNAAPSQPEPIEEMSPQAVLHRAFSERVSGDGRYSLRRFAQDLAISPQQLSAFLSGKKGLSADVASRIASHLELTDREREFFVTCVQARFARNRAAKTVARNRLADLRASQLDSRVLSVDAFTIIANWHHYALLQLIKITPPRQRTAEHFARRLSISENETALSLERLSRLKLIDRTKAGWKVNQNVVLSSDGVPAESLRKFHRQVLEKAMQAISTQSVEERNLLTAFMPVKRSDIPLAKKLIQKFNRDFMNQVSDVQGEKVYALAIQFFSLVD